MATRPKTDGSAHSAPEKSLEVLFSEALELMGQKDPDKALKALEHVRTEAEARGRVGLARSAKNYLAAFARRSEEKVDVPATPALAALVSLNRSAADEALGVLDAALKADGKNARLLYLKATAHALKDEPEAAAEAMKQAVALDPEFIHQFRLERDFDRVRSSAAFAGLG